MPIGSRSSVPRNSNGVKKISNKHLTERYRALPPLRFPLSPLRPHSTGQTSGISRTWDFPARRPIPVVSSRRCIGDACGRPALRIGKTNAFLHRRLGSTPPGTPSGTRPRPRLAWGVHAHARAGRPHPPECPGARAGAAPHGSPGAGHAPPDGGGGDRPPGDLGGMRRGGKLDFKRTEVSSSQETPLRCTPVAPETRRDGVSQGRAGRSAAPSPMRLPSRKLLGVNVPGEGWEVCGSLGYPVESCLA